MTEQVAALRGSLAKKPRPIDPYSSDSHMLAEASEAKKKQLKAAFGIREDYVEGSAFKFGLQATQGDDEKDKKTEYVHMYLVTNTVWAIYIYIFFS